MNRRTTRSTAPRRSDQVRAVMDDLRKIVRGLRLSARGAERDAGISGAQLFVLHSLAEEAASSLNELAERTFTDQSSVSVVVRRLVERGFLLRKPSRQDGRRIEIALSAAGRKLLSRCPEPTQTRLLRGLGRLEPRELKGIRDGLDVLVREIGMHEDDARMFFDDDDVPKRANKARGR